MERGKGPIGTGVWVGSAVPKNGVFCCVEITETNRNRPMREREEQEIDN